MSALPSRSVPAIDGVAAGAELPVRRRWWTTLTVRVLLLYAATRIVSTVMLLRAAAEHLPPGASGGLASWYFTFTTAWDGAWYERIATEGYPRTVPTDPSGAVTQNTWAFYPIFPMVSRLVMRLTGLPFSVVGSTLALILGLAAVVVMARLLAERVGERAALAVVGLVGVFPAAPVLQAAYTESLALLLLLCTYLLALSRERWLMTTGLAVLIALSRPIAVPLGIVTLVAVLLRWRRRATQPVDRREGFAMLAALVGCGIAGLLWPLIAWLRTDRPTAYTDTMSAWWPGGRQQLLTPWVTMTDTYLGAAGLLLLAGIVVALPLMCAGPWARALGPVLRVWPLAYAAYLMIAQAPGTSTPRYLIMMFPCLAIIIGAGWVNRPRPALIPMWPRVVALAIVFVFFQWQWVSTVWVFTSATDWPP